MEQDEERRKLSQATQQKFEQEKMLVESEKKTAETEVAKHKALLAELTAQRVSLMQSIDPQILVTYERIVKVRKVALARATQDACQACHVRIRPHVLSQVISGESIITCDSCSRILYWQPDAPYEVIQ
jgi:predicted  nucleic acid-binding Zn-ribbon protein